MPYTMTGPVGTALYARFDLAYGMHANGFPIDTIREVCGYTNNSSTYRAIRNGKARKQQAATVSLRAFGIEIEFNGTTRRNVEQHILANYPEIRMEVQGYNHTVQRIWKLITDSSVNRRGVGGEDYEGLEMVSPILSGQDGFEQLKKVVAGIKEAGGGPDSSCGLHVHHDARDLTPMQLAGLLRFYVENQLIIDRFLAPVRRSTRRNRWCNGWQEHEVANLIATAKSDPTRGFRDGYFPRYKTVNVTAYPKYGSIEFRQHQGTMNIEKMMRWIKFGQALVEGAMNFSDPDNVPHFATPPEMIDWLVENGNLPRVWGDKLVAAAAKYDADEEAREAARAARS